MTGTEGSPSYEGRRAISAVSSKRRARRSGRSAEAAPIVRRMVRGADADLQLRRLVRIRAGFGRAYFGAAKATDLSRLFTAAQGFVVDSLTSAAMQAGIWEIIYETDRRSASPAARSRAPPRPGGPARVRHRQRLSPEPRLVQASARIDVLTNDAHQDFLVATIPEPETWMLFGIGLGVVGLMRRRRRRARGAPAPASSPPAAASRGRRHRSCSRAAGAASATSRRRETAA